MKKGYFMQTEMKKKSWGLIPILDKINFKAKVILRGYYLMIKRSIQQENIVLVNVYTPNIEESKHIKQILREIKKQINSNTIIVGDFNTSLTSIARSSKQKISRKTAAVNDTLDQVNVLDIFRALHPKATEYTSFSSAHGTFF
ncbi:hypothetical protein HJG60_009702 [Phyllostomus discolor]|uniref:Craniofacial development protein 2-like n=1 Tax=Phyllostomus discolor TaxID=89673 RepID=A0A834B843_9CHIR|nr:hypothetical protein HJG60_009702 [Phyllostomus discolor]